MNNYRFFIRPGKYYPILVCNDILGWYFTFEGYCYNNYGDTQYHISKNTNKNDFKEISLEETLDKINSSGKENFLKILNISQYKIVEVPKSVQNEIIKILTKNRAFNGDSAHKITSIQGDVLYTLVKNKVIKTIGKEKYYLDIKS